MDAKNDAFELVNKICICIDETDFHLPEFITGVPMADGSKEYQKVYNKEKISLAKQCALITVDLILEGEHLIRTPLSYWQQIREHIKQL